MSVISAAKPNRVIDGFGRLVTTSTFGPLIVLIAFCAVFSVTTRTFWAAGNLSLVVQQSVIVGTLAIGQTMIILTAGIDLANGGIAVHGVKIFISGGDSGHDGEHRPHGARPPARGARRHQGAVAVHRPQVPARRHANDVAVGGIEHKMGIKASTTAVLNFGDSNGCIASWSARPSRRACRRCSI